jgi:hypothetical protein
MTDEELQATFAKLVDAIKRDDDQAAQEAAIVLGKAVIGAILRIADAQERIASQCGPIA